ncbi:hypothetical protein MPH_08009 [Macrophomina phaseolina MS6]|uniref:Uncharacterized protein n=1 Tax=Macrophomina phaseolina (strain MS6) TaxID=1126212 RepID=K2RWZ8_MACPH|nr:hypothetical protein MPH_08009 [Macrophomina phaseolina MS6]
MQRRGSGASAASAPAVRRQPSAGSMSERTFRSPSPSGRARVSPPADANAPPVPAIPKELSPAPQHRRAASEAVTGASKLGDRSTGGAAGQGLRISTASDHGKELSQRASINFSRPMSPRVTPPSSPPTTKTSHSGWFTTPVMSEQKPRQDIRSTAPIASKTPAVDTKGLEQSIQSAANAPVAKKRKKRAPSEVGSHLSEGSMGSKPAGSAIAAESPLATRAQSPPVSVPATDLPPSPQSPQSSVLSDSSIESDGSGSRMRAPGLVRQPSTVMENPEVEEQAERAESVDQLVRVEAPANKSSPKQEVQATSPLADQRIGRGGKTEKLTPASARAVSHERQASLSPARSAHFAPTAVDISNGIKHQPPPRSTSPAKSALKHSPSSSIRTSSPVAFNITGRANSDVSSDAGSYDGYKPSPRKKRGTRVSFDDSLTRGEDSPSSPGSPVGLDSSRWSGRTLQGMDDDLDDIMKPRPALPSFGSIRRERRPVDEEIAEKVTETVPSMSNSIITMAEPLEASSDHAVGGVIARDFEARKYVKGTDEPSAPEVTSVEGTGYVSDDTASSMDEEEMESGKEVEGLGIKARGNGATHLPSIPEKKSAEASPAIEVPQIAVQPATPGTEAENQEPAFEMPGAWSDPDESSFDESLAATTASLASHEQSGDTEPVRGGQFQVFSAKDLQPVESRQSVDHYLDHSQEEDSSDDNSSIYSDAAEDLSEFEGGFASLDAIVDSPVVPPSQESQLATIPESPLAQKPKEPSFVEEASAPKIEKDAKKMQQKEGSKMAEHKPKLTPKAAALQFDAAPILKSPKPKKKATVVPEPVAVAVEPAKKSSLRLEAREAPQPKKPALRTSMRAEKQERQAEGPSGQTTRRPMRTSMRGEPTGLAASRHSDSTVPTREPKGALQKKNIPLPSTQVAAAPRGRSSIPVGPVGSNQVSLPPALGRTLSNSSDASDSSFRRQRRAPSSTAEGKYTLRRSMRSGPSPRVGAPVSAPSLRTASPATAPRSSRLSIRSLSPTGSLFGKRKPMVSTLDSSHSTPRGQGPPPSKSSRFSAGKASAKPVSAPLKSTSSRFQSRYDDSSDDEDGGRLPTFRSRFADSDDEDDVPQLPSELRPVRGIPRAKGEEDGDSTELEDEASDTEGPSSPPQAISSRGVQKDSAVAATNGLTNGVGLQGSLRDSKYATDSPIASPRKEKRSFFGLGKKRRGSVDVQPQAAGVDSPPVTPASPSSKLQRRNSQGRRTSESWPLPPPIPDEVPSKASVRPTTSDGSPARPRLGKRQSTGGETAESEPVDNVAIGRSGKKKKFPMLRKAFGLKD